MGRNIKENPQVLKVLVTGGLLVFIKSWLGDAEQADSVSVGS